MGVKNKLDVAIELCDKLGITLEEVAYIGDDLNDISLLKSVGLSAVPSNTPDYIKKIANVKLKTAGGDGGAFREFVEYYLKETNQLDDLLRLFIESNYNYKQ